MNLGIPTQRGRDQLWCSGREQHFSDTNTSLLESCICAFGHHRDPGDTSRAHTNRGWAACGWKNSGQRAVWYLRGVDPTLLEGAGGGVVGAQVPVLAPVAAEGAVHAGQAPGGKAGVSTGLSTSAGLQSPPGLARNPGFLGKSFFFCRGWF